MFHLPHRDKTDSNQSSVGPGWVIILGQPVLRTSVRKLIIVGVVCLFLMSGAAWYIVREVLWRSDVVDASEAESGETKDPEDMIKAIGLSSLERLLERHMEATEFRDLTSLRVRGIYRSEGLEMGVLLQARAPDLYRQTLEYNDVKIDIGVIDGELWVNQTHPIIDLEDEELSEVNKAVLRMESSIPFLVWRHEGGLAKAYLRLGPNQVEDGVECTLIYNQFYPDTEIVHYIETETALERKRVATVLTGDHKTSIEVSFGDVAEDSIYNFPQGYQVKLNGKRFYEVQFDTFEFNIGIPSFLFEPK